MSAVTDWIDYFVYVVFMLVVFFIFPWSQKRLGVPMLADRNAKWVANNPGTLRRMHRIGRWVSWLQYVFGATSLYFLTRIQLRALPEGLPEKWMLLWTLSMVALYAGILVFGSIGVIWHMAFNRRIPVAEQRRAILAPRSIDDFVPLPVRLVTYLLVTITLAAWAIVAVLGWHDDPAFWARFVIIFGLSVFFWLGTRFAVGRRPNVMDRLFGPDYRRGEVWLTFSTQLLPPIIGGVRLYEELADVKVFGINRAMFLGLALFISAWLLWIVWQTVRHVPRDGEGVRKPSGSSYPAGESS